MPAAVRESIRFACWKTMPMRRRAARISESLTELSSVPSMLTEPDVGRSSRVRQRTRVDFPAPEWPMMP
ncbi:hypothetical protein D9M71_797100 [compost metagenome]